MFSRNRMTQTLPGGGGPANRVLATLPADDYQRLAPHLRTVFLQSRQVLTREGDPLQQLVFPLTALCSLTKAMGNGSSVESRLLAQKASSVRASQSDRRHVRRTSLFKWREVLRRSRSKSLGPILRHEEHSTNLFIATIAGLCFN